MTASQAPAQEGRAEALVRLERPERRIEGPLKVTGAARYAGDLRMPGMLWSQVLTSPYPHARIAAVDTSAALAIPGVVAVLTGEDVRGKYFGRGLMDWPVLAWDRVRFIGDRVAVVAAETREAAQEAIQAIRVEYEELPPVLEPDEALRSDAPVIHPDGDSYPMLAGKRRPRSHANVQGTVVVEKGERDLDAAFAACDRVFEHTFHTPRQHQGYIEPHATVAWMDEDGALHVVTTNKSPFSLRRQLSVVMDMPADRVIVDSMYIGGDFGGKGLSIDEFTCALLARATGRPVRAVMTYVDELQAMNPRHASTVRLRTGVDAEGRFLVHEAEVIFNGGAYGGGKPGDTLVPGGGSSSLAAYHIPTTRLTFHTVYTNTVPCGHMRAPADVQVTFASESHVDLIARALGVDPLELRRRNAVRQGQTGPGNERFREARALEVLDALEREAHWNEPLPEGHGRGMALAVRHVGGGKTAVVLRLCEDGMVEAKSAVPDQGSGGRTVIQRVVATALSVPAERVRVVYGSTADAPQDPGSGGSRVTHIVGAAALEGATVLKERLLELAAEVMGWPAGEIRLENDRFVVDESGEDASFLEVAQRIAQGEPVTVDGGYDSAHGPDEPADFNFSATLVEVAVDRETGQVRVVDALLSLDVGAVINPVAHRGQVLGGFVYGVGGALMEDLDVEGGKVTTLSLGEYKLPTEEDVPPLRVVYCPTDVGSGPYGAKMAGEVSNAGVAPAIANAVEAACGARVTELPITSERVLEALG